MSGPVSYSSPNSALPRSRSSFAGRGHLKSLLIAKEEMGHVVEAWVSMELTEVMAVQLQASRALYGVSGIEGNEAEEFEVYHGS